MNLSDADRILIDPDGRYPADGLRLAEASAARVFKLFPVTRLERTRDVLQLEVGAGEAGVTLLITAEHLELRLPTVEWPMGAYGPADSSRFWKRVRCVDLTDDRLRTLIEAALAKRRSEFRNCRYCGEAFPPERLHSRNVCHDCAERHLGVVH